MSAHLLHGFERFNLQNDPNLVARGAGFAAKESLLRRWGLELAPEGPTNPPPPGFHAALRVQQVDDGTEQIPQ
jgi:hypothetical protein